MAQAKRLTTKGKRTPESGKQDSISKAQFTNNIAAMGKMSKETRAKVTCAMLGHSLIVSAGFGYIYCGRCSAQIADKLTGSFNGAPECVQIGHNCADCRKNFKALGWKHKIFTPNPFKAEKATA